MKLSQLLKTKPKKAPQRTPISLNILPARINEETESVLINGNTYIRTIVAGIPENAELSGYPEKMNPFLMAELMAIEGEDFVIDISYALSKIKAVDALRMFDKAAYLNQVEQVSYLDPTGKDKTRQPPPLKKLQEQAYVNNISAVFDNDESVFNTSLIIRLKSNSVQGLRAAESRVIGALSGSRVFYEIPDCAHKDVLFSSMAVPEIFSKTTCQLFSQHASTILPLQSPGSRLSETGALLGETNESNPRPVLIDLEKLLAQHMFVVGASGTGKTYFLLLRAMRALTMEQKRVILITPKADVGTNHINVVNYFKGCLIELGRGKEKNINPFEIFVKTDRQYAEMVFFDHVDILKNFFLTLVLSETPNRDNMLSYLDRTIHQCYESKGIYRTDPTTWHDWPVLEDIYRIWEQERGEDVTAEALYNKSGSIITAWSFLNRQSNIDLSSDLIVFDTSGMRAADSSKLQDSFNLLITAMMSMRFKHSDKKTMIIVDESRVFLQTEKLANFLMRVLMEGRSAGLELVIACQQPSDLVKADIADEMKTNISVHVILGGMNTTNVNIVKTFFQLDDHAKERLLALGKGQGLILVGNQIIETNFKATDLEHKIIKGLTEGTKDLSPDSTFKCVNPEIEQFILQHKIAFEDWIQCDSNTLLEKGLKAKKCVDALSGNNVRIWLASVPENMSDDHYTTVMRIAGSFAMLGHTVGVNHHSDVDVVVDQKIAFEYERAGTHTFEQLTEKRNVAKERYEQVYFVSQYNNYNDVKNAVGTDNTIKRGNDLRKIVGMISKELKT